MSVIISLVSHECTSACEGLTTIEERIPAAMKAAREHYMCPTENEMFMGACCALYELSDDPTKARIKQELDAIKYLNAMMSGVAVDLDTIPKMENPLGLMAAFRAAKS